jgi:hypothetical protein
MVEYTVHFICSSATGVQQEIKERIDGNSLCLIANHLLRNPKKTNDEKLKSIERSFLF